MRLRFAIALSLLAGLLAPVMAQQSSNASGEPLPTVTFTLDFPKSNPEHYMITVDSAGHARYECAGTVADDSDPQTYKAEFEISAENRNRIFDWVKQAKYFSGKVDSGNKVAFTGEKQLSYQDSQRSNTARYNYSNLEPVQQLTELFQKIAATQDYGHRLAYYHRYQKLALDEQLKQMEAQALNHELSEIHSVARILQAIVDDSSVLNVVRGRAKELLDMKYDGAPWR